MFSYIKKLDADMRHQNRKIVLTLDNFSAHYTDYTPTNILLIFFEPNLTAWIQPLDGGIIRCLKAHYRREYCRRALDLDEAGEEDIWGMNLLEGMRMVKASWEAVSVSTIANCWRHVQILSTEGQRSEPQSSESLPLEKGWAVVLEFAQSSMSLPEAEEALKRELVDQFKPEDWEMALKVVMDAEGDVHKALTDLEALRASAAPDTGASSASASLLESQLCADEQLKELEDGLMLSVRELKERRRIWGDLPTIKDMLEPNGEDEVGEDDETELLSDEQIAARAAEELAGGPNSEEEEENPVMDDNQLSSGAMINMASELEKGCLRSECESSLQLAQALRRWRAEMSSLRLKNAKQTSIATFFGAK
jgi:hypothetical protein